jgi:hypothetical protein
MLRGEDLSGFYAPVQDDELSWCALAAGRMLGAPTVFGHDDAKGSSRRWTRARSSLNVCLELASTHG